MSDIREFGEILPNVTYVERPGAYAFIVNELSQLALVRTPHGSFLPGGGLDPGEDPLTGLARELREEIGYELVDARLLVRAAQYHWSAFYKSYFRKVGSFFEVDVKAPEQPFFEPDHELIWVEALEAERLLTQEFQRWAVSQFRSK